MANLTLDKLLTLFVSLLSLTVSYCAYRQTRTLTSQQLSLQTQTTDLARIQREMIEAARQPPNLRARVFPVTIHAADGTINDTAVEMVFQNGSSLNVSMDRCSVGFQTGIGVEAEYRDRLATFPIVIGPNSSLILYSFGRRLKPLYERAYPSSKAPAPIEVIADISGIAQPMRETVGTYVPGQGLRSLK